MFANKICSEKKRIKMSIKRLLKFYFAADGINRALDNLILNEALKAEDSERGCLYFAERIAELIDVKDGLTKLWQYLDGVAETFSSEERELLETYAERGKRCAPQSKLKKVTVKFSRRLRRIKSFEREAELLGKYYNLCGVKKREE